MGYIAVKGGAEAIEHAARYLEYERIKGGSKPVGVDQIRDQLFFAVDRVMGEGSLYSPEMAALAIKQSSGDLLEAAFMLRAYRATRPRLGYSIPRPASGMRVIRRISAVFKDIPGGQILGPTSDYTLRLLDFDLIEETEGQQKESLKKVLEGVSISAEADELTSLPKVLEILKHDGLLEMQSRPREPRISDVTRESMEFPATRSAAMQSMARGETGGMLLLAYSNMRGFGSVHPTIGELRVGYLPVTVKHPVTGEDYVIGEVKVTEAEILAQKFENTGDGVPRFTLGYGLCFGHNEVKAISMAVLDKSMQASEPKAPSEDQEFVLYHIDGIESMGFCIHFKLPHYVTFQSSLDRVRRSQAVAVERKEKMQKKAVIKNVSK